MNRPRPDSLQNIFRDMMKIEPEPRPQFPGYRLLEEVGGGGFGVVFRAFDEKLEREVALKLLQPGPGADRSAGERFLVEARALARVRHPNVLTIHGALEHEGRMALCTEFVNGRTLEQRLRDRGPLGVDEAIDLAIELCHALKAVHAAGIVHRDVKSSNVLLEESGRVVLADFGLGVFLSKAAGVEAWGAAAGSPAFMAPEQVAGEPVDPRCDLYSLGVLLYHAVSGRFPFEGRDTAQLFASILAGEPRPLTEARPDCPPAVERAVLQALRKNPADRFQSAEEMAEALAACRTAPAGRRAVASRSPARRLRWWAAAAAIIAAGAAAFFFTGHGRESFEVRASFLAVEGGHPSPVEPGRGMGRGACVRIELEVDMALFVYVLLEDQRGKAYLLHPPGGPENRGPLAAGRRHLLPKSEDPQACYRVGEGPDEEWLICIASTEPLGPLEDAVPEKPASPGTGKEGWPRLKPVTIRGLARSVLGEAAASSAAGVDGTRFRLSEIAGDWEGPQAETCGAGRFWIRKLAAGPAAQGATGLPGSARLR